MKMTKLAIASVLKREELNLSSKLEEVEFFSFYRCYASYVIFIIKNIMSVLLQTELRMHREKMLWKH